MGLSVIPAPASGLVKYTQLFTSSGTFTLPSGYGSTNPLFVDVVVVGGGGGGGAGATNYYGGGGGGSGCGFYYQQIPVYANTTVTIGSGGTGGTVASANQGNDGTNGGSSFFGDLEAPGGGFGKGSRQSPGGTYGSSNWTSTAHTYGKFLTHMSAHSGAATDRVGGPGGSAGADGEVSSSTDVAGIFGGISSKIQIKRIGLSYQEDTYYSSTTEMALSQGAAHGGGSYNGTAGGFIWQNAGEGLIVSQYSPGQYGQSDYYFGYIGKYWWIPGGGGGGGNTVAGTAGSRTLPGRSTARTGFTVGESASANTGGGGGGGARNGAGGAGGSGYVLVTYWA